MQILLAHRYFWPDSAPYGLLLRQIATLLSQQENFQVTVFTGQPAYSKAVVAQGPRPRTETIDGGATVMRARLFSEQRFRSLFRNLNAILFSLQLAARILVQRPKVVMCSTQPPIFGAALAQFAAGIIRAKFIYHLQDIHPEVAWVGGQLRKSFVPRLLRWVDARTCRKADHVVVLSTDMAESIRKRTENPNSPVHVIQNYNLPDYSERLDVPEGFKKKPGIFRLLFAGNVGHFQNLDKLVAATSLVGEEHEFELVIMGDGKAKPELQKQVANNNNKRVVFLPYQPLSIAEPLMSEADLCVVSLLPDVYRYAFPSKLITYMSQGCPVLVLAESESELGRFPERYKIGYSCSQESVDQIARTIEFAIASASDRAEFSERSQQAWQDFFGREQIDAAWVNLIQSCDTTSANQVSSGAKR
ncbi:glycosyltransferase family 4 protein [Novipirellula herctigrandis]|uniref:glycosyltransferase family 4 protein n=1 Tax=Novipirellula herctigrandis TaxID=2527986 RepID=UPI003AF3D60D